MLYPSEMQARQAIINLDNLENNLRIIKNLAPHSSICLAVKANAYGHGAIKIAQSAENFGVKIFGVATLDEALELREAGIQARILLYGLADFSELTKLVEYKIEPFVCDKNYLEALALVARNKEQTVNVHIKVDTGMGRLGCEPGQALALCDAVLTDANLKLAGLCTHFPCAETNAELSTRQIAILEGLASDLKKHKGCTVALHAANSAGLVLVPESRLDIIRPGIMAYGYEPVPGSVPGLKPVMEVRACLRFVKKVKAGTSISYGHRWTAEKDTHVGTISLGYADGLPRLASGKLNFSINGLGYKQIGTICMDQCMLDLGNINIPPENSEVIIFGWTKNTNTAQDLAEVSNTISYEILCGISPRVPRIYTGGS